MRALRYIALILLAAVLSPSVSLAIETPCGPLEAGCVRVTALRFDSQGELMNRAELDASLARASSSPTLLVGFVHGWKQSYEDDGPAFRDFTALVQRMGLHEAESAYLEDRPPRAVEGVFLGWPGNATRLPGLQAISWFGRREIGLKVAGTGMPAVMARLAAASQAAQGHFVLIGHSLGATMIARGLAINLLERAPSPDSIVMINPAIESGTAGEVYLLAESLGGRAPYMLTVTAADDSVLKFGFPIGRMLSELLGLSGSESGGLDAMTTSIRTHALRATPGGSCAGDWVSQIAEPLLQNSAVVDFCGSTLSRVDGRANPAPLVMVRAGQSVMRGHNDLRSEVLGGFISQWVLSLASPRYQPELLSLRQQQAGGQPLRFAVLAMQR